MSLSLEPKKFINSEHTGLYTTISVPGRHKSGMAEINVHYMDEGTGEPLLLIHTLGQSLYTWRSIFTRLAENYRVIAIDLPGHGYTGKPLNFDYSIADQAHAILMTMDALGIQSAHILAYSMGCAYACEFCRKYPDRVGRLILMSPGGITEYMPAPIRMMQNSALSMFATLMLSSGRIEDMLLECFLDRTTVTPQMVNEYFITLADSDAKRALRLCVRNYDEDAAISGLREIENPALILWGADDKWHPRDLAELYHAAMRNANFALIRNAGHLLHEEKPEKIINAVRDFIPLPAPEPNVDLSDDNEADDSIPQQDTATF